MLIVGLGGGLGSMLRFLTSRLSLRFISSNWSLIGTLIANVVGCFLIGLLAGWLLSNMGKDETLSLLLITGFCGGYTTFSAFAFESVQLWQLGNSVLSIFYIFFSIVFGLLAVWAGLSLK